LVHSQNRTILVNVKDMSRALANSLSDTLIREQETGVLGGPLRRREVPGGYVVSYAVDTEKIYRFDCQALPVPESGLCGARLREEFVIQDTKGQLLYQLRALTVLPAGEGEVVVATSPVCEEGGKLAWCEEVLARMEAASPSAPVQYAKGTTNLFVVDIDSGKAKFLATVRYDPPTRIRPVNWPLTADANFVAWTEAYCGQPQGKTRVLNRKSGSIRELDAGLWVRLGASAAESWVWVSLEPGRCSILGACSTRPCCPTTSATFPGPVTPAMPRPVSRWATAASAARRERYDPSPARRRTWYGAAVVTARTC
jgi:hypothetical protein